VLLHVLLVLLVVLWMLQECVSNAKQDTLVHQEHTHHARSVLLDHLALLVLHHALHAHQDSSVLLLHHHVKYVLLVVRSMMPIHVSSAK
jgi:hypothetical protein